MQVNKDIITYAKEILLFFLPVRSPLKHWQDGVAETTRSARSNQCFVTQGKSTRATTTAASKPLGIPSLLGPIPSSKIGGGASGPSSLYPWQPSPSRGKGMQS